MARRSLTDQRHLLVELELDESVLDHQSHHAPLPSATRVALHRASLDRPTPRTPSPYKLKQKVLSSRARPDVEPRTRKPTPSPLVLIADAIRDNVTQRHRVLIDVQDELQRLPPVRNGSSLLPLAVVRLLNRLRSLTLSIVEMVRYFHEQLPPHVDPVVLAMQYEFQETLGRLSDLDGLTSSPFVALFFESLGVSAWRNPFLDGVALDASELLLWSCQAAGATRGTSSSLSQLVVARLEAFAVDVRRQCPAWQTLPAPRVARALLDLVECENRANATRMLPSYLRPESSYRSRYVPVAERDTGIENEFEEQSVTSQAWIEPTRYDELPRRTSATTGVEPRSPQPSVRSVAPVTRSPRDVAETVTFSDAVAEPKPIAEAPRRQAKKTTRVHERAATVSALDVPKAETKAIVSRIKETVEHVESTRFPTPRAVDKLPQVLPAASVAAVSSRRPVPSVRALVSEPTTRRVEDQVPTSARDQKSGVTEPSPRLRESPRQAAIVENVPMPLVFGSPRPTVTLSDVQLPAISISPRPSEGSLPETTPLLQELTPQTQESTPQEVTPPPQATTTLLLPQEVTPMLPDPSPQAMGPMSQATPTPLLPQEVTPWPQEPSTTILPQEVTPPPQATATPLLRQTTAPIPQDLPMPLPQESFTPLPQQPLTPQPQEPQMSLPQAAPLVQDSMPPTQEAPTTLHPEKTSRTEDSIPQPQPLVPQSDTDAVQDPTTSELSRILSLCRAVQDAASDMSERLDAQEPSDTATVSASTIEPPHLVLSTRYLERELKMLRRYFHRWATARQAREARLAQLRVVIAARQITEFWQSILYERRARETRRRHRFATRIQRQWRRWRCAQAFHLLHRCFFRFCFFTRVEMRRRRRTEAATTLQRWWRHCQRRERAAERRLANQQRRHAAARRLQAFVTEHSLRRQLMAAQDATQRVHMMQNLRALKARQEEDKRRKLESKRLAELRATMQLALREMEAKWTQAEADKTQLLETQAENERRQQHEAQVAMRQLARTVIDGFLDRAVLRRRLAASIQANEAIANAAKALEKVRERLERRQREAHAAHLLQRRMVTWKADKTMRDANDRLWRLEHARCRDREIATETLTTHIRASVAHERVLEYCGVATSFVVETTYASRLAAKRDEATRLRRQAAGERLAHWVSQLCLDRRLAKTQRDATEERQRLHSQHVLNTWLTRCVHRRRTQRVVETVQRQAETVVRVEVQRRLAAEFDAATLRQAQQLADAQRHRREQLAQLQRRKSHVKEQQLAEKHARHDATTATMHEQIHAQLKAELERQRVKAQQREMQRQLEHARIVDVILTTQRLADTMATTATAAALASVQTTCDCLVLQARCHRIGQRARHREVVWRWWQFVQRRHTVAAVTTHLLWPQRATDDDEAPTPSHRIVRLGELRRMASARTVQRGWRAMCKRVRRREAKRIEDALVAQAKAPKRIVSPEQVAQAAAMLVRWLRRCHRVSQLRVQIENQTLFFSGGRAWIVVASETVPRLRCDRVVTRKLLQVPRADMALVLKELSLDVAPILLTATTGVRDVDETELPQFALATRALNKTWSIVKRQNLLDAKLDGVAHSVALTVFDAVETASVDDAAFLLRNGADLSIREPIHGRSALHMLAFNRTESLAARVALLRFLVDRAKLDLDARDDHGDSPLMAFATHGCVPLMDAVLDAGSDLWCATNADGRTAFHCACANDQPEAALRLQTFVLGESESRLQELYAADKHGVTPVHTLAAQSHLECLGALMEPLDTASNAAVVNMRDSSGATPLHAAIHHNHLEIVRSLLSHGARVDAGDAWQRRTLHVATRATDAVALVTLLAAHNVDVNAADARGDTALHWAAANGRTGVVRELLVRGADPHALNSDGATPADVATAYCHVECARLLAVGSSSSGSDVANDTTRASAQSYSFLVGSPPPRRRDEIDWDELQCDVELVDESGHSSSDEEME